MSSGIGPAGPSDRNMYEQEYRHGADLFQRALDQYSQSKDANQKAEFKHVMDQALDVLKKSAHGLKDAALEQQSQEIAKDYKAFQKDPGNGNMQKLNSDLDQAKNSL